MARKILVPYDFAKNEIRNAVVQNLSASPSSPVPGQLYYDTDDNKLYFWNNSAWEAASGASGGPPTGSAGGDLTGTYPNPTLSSAKDANVKARANHTGTQTASTISDFDTQVRTSRLDQMAAPTADVAFNSRKITGLLDGTNPQDAATVSQLSAAITGVDFKSVRAATTATITISTALNSGDTIDGVTLANGDLVLVKDQSSPAENGVYVVSGSPARVDWMDAAAEVDGRAVIVEDGSVNAGRMYFTASEVTTLGTDAISFTKIFAPSDLISLATGVTGTLPIANGGTGQTTAKLSRESGLISAGYYSSATHSAGTSIAITAATHGLRASRGLVVQVQEEATGDVWEADVSVASNGDVTVNFAVSQGANTIRVTILG